MSFNGSGLFVINSLGNPVVTGTTISTAWANALSADLATGLSTCILKDGTQATTARIPFANGINSTLATDATSTSTGSILTAGGISAAKALWIGGLANIAGVLTNGATADSTSTATGSIITAGGIGAAKALWIGGLANIAGAITGQSTITGTNIILTTAGLFLGGSAVTDILITRSVGVCSIRLGDNSTYGTLDALAYKLSGSAALTASNLALTASDTGLDLSNGTTVKRMASDGRLKLSSQTTAVEVAANIGVGGLAAANILLKNSASSVLTIRKGDDSANAGLICGDLTVTGSANLGGASGTFTNSVIVVNGLVTGGT